MKGTYPSRHMANTALCRMFDKGAIDFETWLAQPIVKIGNRFAIILENKSRSQSNDH